MKQWESPTHHWKETSTVSVCLVLVSRMGQVLASDAESSG